jgi:hypothetical protein
VTEQPASSASDQQAIQQPVQPQGQQPGRLPTVSKRLGDMQMAAWPGAFGWNFKIEERMYQTADGQRKKTAYLRAQDLSNLLVLIEFMLDFALTTPMPSQDNDDPPTM